MNKKRRMIYQVSCSYCVVPASEKTKRDHRENDTCRIAAYDVESAISLAKERLTGKHDVIVWQIYNSGTLDVIQTESKEAHE